MSKSGKRWLLWISVFILFVAIGGLIYLSLIPFSKYVDNFQILCAILITLSFVDLLVLFFIRYQDRKWLKKSGIISAILLLPLSVIFYKGVAEDINFPNIILIILLVLLCLSGLLTLIYIFIVRKPDELRSLITLLILIVICLVGSRLKRSFPLIEDFILPELILITSVGIYTLGVRCLFIIEKNRYLKIFAFIACTLTALGCFTFMLKFLGNEFNILELSYFIPAFLLTLIVLLSLPVSGYINWPSFHKKILKKIAIAWVFFLLIFSVRFLYPDFFKVLITREYAGDSEFWLEDYDVPNKNGLEVE